MALSVSAFYLPPATTSLTPAEQKLSAQPLTDSATQALANNAGPAAIYHPSAPLEAMPPGSKAIDTWVGRDQSQDFPRLDVAAGVFRRVVY